MVNADTESQSYFFTAHPMAIRFDSQMVLLPEINSVLNDFQYFLQ